MTPTEMVAWAERVVKQAEVETPSRDICEICDRTFAVERVPYPHHTFRTCESCATAIMEDRPKPSPVREYVLVFGRAGALLSLIEALLTWSFGVHTFIRMGVLAVVAAGVGVGLRTMCYHILPYPSRTVPPGRQVRAAGGTARVSPVNQDY